MLTIVSRRRGSREIVVETLGDERRLGGVFDFDDDHELHLKPTIGLLRFVFGLMPYKAS
jgi:hypothetical protein